MEAGSGAGLRSSFTLVNVNVPVAAWLSRLTLTLKVTGLVAGLWVRAKASDEVSAAIADLIELDWRLVTLVNPLSVDETSALSLDLVSVAVRTFVIDDRP